MISKILVPHDGTEISDKAVTRAIEFAKAFNSEIILLHVIKDNLEEAWNQMSQNRSVQYNQAKHKVYVESCYRPSFRKESRIYKC